MPMILESNLNQPNCQTALRASSIAVVFSLVMCFPSRSATTQKVEIKISPMDPKEAAKVSYTRDIKPLLANDCEECHSGDDQKSGLDVSSVAALKKGGRKAGPSIIAGKPDESPLVKYVRGLADGPQMPKGEPALNAHELHLIRSWIAAGATDDTGKTPPNSRAPKAQTRAISIDDVKGAEQVVNAFIFVGSMDQFKARSGFCPGLVPPAPQESFREAFNAIDPFAIALRP